MKQTEILTHATHVNGWEPAVYMSCMSQNFRLFHVSNLSVRNFRIFLLMYTGSRRPRPSPRRHHCSPWQRCCPEHGGAVTPAGCADGQPAESGVCRAPCQTAVPSGRRGQQLRPAGLPASGSGIDPGYMSGKARKLRSDKFDT